MPPKRRHKGRKAVAQRKVDERLDVFLRAYDVHAGRKLDGPTASSSRRSLGSDLHTRDRHAPPRAPSLAPGSPPFALDQSPPPSPTPPDTGGSRGPYDFEHTVCPSERRLSSLQKQALRRPLSSRVLRAHHPLFTFTNHLYVDYMLHTFLSSSSATHALSRCIEYLDFSSVFDTLDPLLFEDGLLWRLCTLSGIVSQSVLTGSRRGLGCSILVSIKCTVIACNRKKSVVID